MVDVAGGKHADAHPMSAARTPGGSRTSPPARPPAPPYLTVRQVMTPHVRTVQRRQTARVAAELMRTHHIQHLIVVDVAGRVCGVLSDRDIRAASPSSVDKAPSQRTDPLADLRVDELMAPHPVTVSPTDDIVAALKAMRARKIGCLAVVDELGGAIGIITGYDVVTLALKLLETVTRP